MNRAGKRVAVVVVSYNSANRLRACIEPLAKDARIEVAVVDNSSQDGSPATVADLDVEVLAQERTLGFGAGCNVGWRATTAPSVLFLNPDARIAPEDVVTLAAALEETGAGAVSPRIEDESGHLEWSLRRFPSVRSVYSQAFFAYHFLPRASWTDELIREPDRYRHSHSVDWASGACLLVGRDTLERISGFDEGFFMYAEDVDLCRRIWDDGRKVVYVPSVTCVHAGGASAPRWALLPVLAASRIRYAKRHFGRMRATVYRMGIGLSALTRVLASRGAKQRLGHVRALAVALGLQILLS
jgi:GT2 family glycosyltransferase